jgi:carbamoyltransferase
MHSNTTGYILGVSRGHNAGVCLLKDGKIVFSLEEERLSRYKYDGSPYAAIKKVLEYTDKVDFVVTVHTQALRGGNSTAGIVEYTGDDTYTGLARKFGLIDRTIKDVRNHPQVIDMSLRHHATHAAVAFYNSGFDKAAAVVIDGAGSAFNDNSGNVLWEVESILDCSYTNGIQTVFKHLGCREPIPTYTQKGSGEFFGEPNSTTTVVVSDRAGIVKAYEAVTQFCGFHAIEAGKTMGLSPYGRENQGIPAMMLANTSIPLVSRDVILPTYPNAAILNSMLYPALAEVVEQGKDATLLQSRRDAAYWVQRESQDAALACILQAVNLTGNSKVVLSGGYGLNCVANYYYLTKLNELGIELYVEPISNDGGTAIGAALLFYYENTPQDTATRPKLDSLYLGPQYHYSDADFDTMATKFNAQVISNITNKEIVDLLIAKNIVCMYQGRSENGPRALGNRSVLFDPTFKDGKDYVNLIKRREYFRPFAASVLADKADKWFDLRGMSSSPHMMYAVNCLDGVAEKIPSVIHEDNTCRIQTVTAEQNSNYYDLIQEYEKVSGIPLLFNTSFNLGGEPLVETLEDAFWTLSKSNLQYCYFPEYGKLVLIKNT